MVHLLRLTPNTPLDGHRVADHTNQKACTAYSGEASVQALFTCGC